MRHSENAFPSFQKEDLPVEIFLKESCTVTLRRVSKTHKKGFKSTDL
jgi:hypothetical protein